LGGRLFQTCGPVSKTAERPTDNTDQKSGILSIQPIRIESDTDTVGILLQCFCEKNKNKRVIRGRTSRMVGDV